MAPHPITLMTPRCYPCVCVSKALFLGTQTLLSPPWLSMTSSPLTSAMTLLPEERKQRLRGCKGHNPASNSNRSQFSRTHDFTLGSAWDVTSTLPSHDLAGSTHTSPSVWHTQALAPASVPTHYALPLHTCSLLPHHAQMVAFTSGHLGKSRCRSHAHGPQPPSLHNSPVAGWPSENSLLSELCPEK